MSIVRDVATVTVSEPVDGTVKRRSGARRVLVTDSTTVVVHPAVLAAAKRARRDGERLVLVSATEVWLVPA